MKTIFIIVISVIFYFILLFIYCALRLSSEISKKHEENDF